MRKNFVIRPRRYADKLDAIKDMLENAVDDDKIIDIGRNPNGKWALLFYAVEEITRLRLKCGEAIAPRATKLLPGRRPVAESNVLKIETEGE